MKGRSGYDRLTVEWWLVAILSSILVLFMVADRTTARLDNIIYDTLLRFGTRAPSPAILIVAIDNRSLKEAGSWPWPRDRHARLLATLGKGHPRAIGYDILFTEPTNAVADGALGQAVADAGPVFLPLLLIAPGTDGAAFDAIQPIAPLRRAATGIGHVNLTFDADGLVRRIALSAGGAQHRWPHLMQLLRSKAQRGTGPTKQADTDIPRLIPYAGGPGHFPAISAASVLRGEVPPEFLKDRLILVGATADGMGDQYPTPLAGDSGVMSGIEIQANLLDALMTGRLIQPVAPVIIAIVSLLPLWMLLLAFRRLPPRATIILLVALLVVIAAATAAMLAMRLWMPPVAAIVGLAIVYPLWGWRRLAAVSAYMIDELEGLRAEPDILPGREPASTGADIVGRHTALLRDAIGRMQDMRHFVTDRLHQMPDATIVTDNEGQVVLANAEAQRLFDSLHIGIEQRGDIRALLAMLRRSDESEDSPPEFPTGTGGALLASEVHTADGRFFDLRFAAQHSRDGEAVGWIVRITDTSAVKAAERQREDVLQLLTHDMRSPQTSIITSIDGAAPGQIAAPLAERLKHYALRTLGLADGFVQLARAESLDYAMEEIDLADVLVDAIDDLWPQSTGRGISIAATGATEGVLVRGERSLLTRALINLIGNAIKYSHDGGRIDCNLSMMRYGNSSVAICSISDAGIGIAPEHLDQLFARFRRVPGGTQQRIDGVGLGLSFVHMVATRHGGTIRCESSAGRGSVFTLTLPVGE